MAKKLISYDDQKPDIGLPDVVVEQLDARFGGAGLAPHIGENGNWWVGDEDTGVNASGPQGEGGTDGLTPHIEGGNWWIGDTDTGVPARGPAGPGGGGGGGSITGIINAENPPEGIAPLVADANYYDAATFKYYSDPGKTTPATDNRAAMQAMVDHLYNNGGGTIQLPRGKFAFRGTIVWKSRVSLRGAGKMVTSLFAEGELFSLIERTAGVLSTGASTADPNMEWLEDCTFQDFAIDNKGLSYPTFSVGGKALFLLYMKRAVFRDLLLINTIGTALGCDFLVDTVIDSVIVRNAGRNAHTHPNGYYGGNSGIGIGTHALSKEPLVVSNCFVYDCGNYGVFVETQHNPNAPDDTLYAKIVNTHAEGCHKGFGNKGSGATHYVGCTADGNATHGFHLTQSSSGDKLLGCTARGNGESGVSVYAPYGGDVSIHSTVATENLGTGLHLHQGGSSYSTRNFSVVGCEASRNGLGGITSDGQVTNLTISSTHVFENGLTSTNNFTNRGIRVNGSPKMVSLIGNTVYDEQETKTQIVGVHIANTATNVVIVGNNVVGYTDANAYQYLAENTTFEANNVPTRRYGTTTLPETEVQQWVYHNHGKVPSRITLTPLGDARVWVENNEANRVRVRRETAVGPLDVMWTVE